MTTPADLNIESRMAEIIRRAEAREQALRTFLADCPPTIACASHPEVIRLISFERSQLKTAKNDGELCVAYEPCGICQAERAENDVRERLKRQGVPDVLLHCTFENWSCPDDSHRGHLEVVREFCRARCGCLALLGGLGVGKSHLAVAAMRHFKDGLFVKQNTLLRRLRATYRDAKAGDPVEEAQRTGLFVLDEVGLTSGGRDELPALHEALDFRHGHRKPTIVTSNLTWEQLGGVIGDRLADRFTESAFRILVFGGTSKRPTARKRYFAGAANEPPGV